MKASRLMQVRHKRREDRPDMRWTVLHNEPTGYVAQRSNIYGPGLTRRFLSKDDYEPVPEPAPCLVERWLTILGFLFCGIAGGALAYLWLWAP